MPLPHEHSARLQDPGKFDSFGRTHGGNLYGDNLKVPSTIDVVWGHPKGGPGDVAIPQALRFPISDWTEEEARKWLKDHSVKFISFEPAAKQTQGMTEMKIQAQILAMAEAEILGMISPRTIRDIKREDPNPKLMAFVVGQEGEARPKVVGLGATVQRWFRSAIEALTDRLPLGIAAYHDHAQSNAAAGRQPIGEIVGKALRHIGGALSAIAVAYIYPAFRALNLDVASIEANILIPQDTRQFDVTDVDVKEVTGVALGNSADDKHPAFPGATLLAQLQAFAEKDPEKGDTKMTTADLQKAIREAGLHPSDIFNAKEIEADPSIAELMKESTPASKEFARMRQELKEAERNFREAEIKVVALEKEKKDLAEKVQVSERTIVKGKAKEAFDGLLIERPKLKEDARLLKFVNKAFDKGFQPTDELKLKDELNKFVDDQVKDFQDLFGESKAGDKGKEAKPEGSGGGSGDDIEELKKSELFPKD